jgi:hypothetical protein
MMKGARKIKEKILTGNLEECQSSNSKVSLGVQCQIWVGEALASLIQANCKFAEAANKRAKSNFKSPKPHPACLVY